MGFIRKAMVVVAVTLGLTAGASGIAQANTAAPEPSVQVISPSAPAATIVDVAADGARSSLDTVVTSVLLPVALPVALPFIITALAMICVAATNPDNLSLQGLGELCPSFGSS
ncbi:hypothetical protein [Rhodococcus xishaensis]|uniref:Uncharacterized protein n=1 Tax=Rhodococcus xishaensis TaxID=2487364 RepID=A0A3S3B120_9NOCA|nr:hypothetical protein [Rhodococcus xishaensis]RVW00635.1 hypothetical protein EGT50_14925 [Rhodococcus xishaensis]